MTYIDTLVVIPQNVSTHIFENFKILLPFGCVMVSSIIWMFHEQRTETRELAVFISALFLALLTILHVVVLRVVSKFTFIKVFVFWFLVFRSLWLCDFFLVFFRLSHLALQNVNKDFCNLAIKIDQKPKTKNGMNETFVSRII